MLPPVASLVRRTIAPGEVIFLEGQPADTAYVILKGEAQVVTHGAGGEEMVINRMTLLGRCSARSPSCSPTACARRR